MMFPSLLTSGSLHDNPDVYTRRVNRWGIPDWLENEVRERDRECVYCRVTLLDAPGIDGSRKDVATWEHIVNDERIITRKNIARCCASCNSTGVFLL